MTAGDVGETDVSRILEHALLRIDQDIAQVSADLQEAHHYIYSRFVQRPEASGWPQFLDESGPPTATGTACVASSLIRMGVKRQDVHLIEATDLLCSEQCADGGWSKPGFADHLSLTLVTCLSLHALAALGLFSGHPVVDEGLMWLSRAQNDDGGWGCLASDDLSDVTATAYALRALDMSHASASPLRQVRERGADWLVRQQNDDGGWGIRHGERSTAAHTAHAVEGMQAAHMPWACAAALDEAKEWLLTTLPQAPLVPWIEHYQLPASIASGLPRRLHSARLRWTHLPAERSLIALLGLGVDVHHPTVRRLVDDLAQRHEKELCWQVPGVPAVSASWAVLEAVNALSRYLDAVEASRWRTVCQVLTVSVVPRIAELEKAQEELRLRTDALATPPADKGRRAWKTLLSPRVLAIELTAVALGGGLVATLGTVSGADTEALVLAGAAWIVAIPLFVMAARRG